MMKSVYLCAVCTLLVHAFGFSQDSITVKDAAAIKFRAEQVVLGQYLDLLNTLASDDLEPTDRSKLIQDAHSGDRKIFESANAIVQDDVNPAHTSAADATELDVARYLGDFDLMYMKGKEASVRFLDPRTSP